MTQAHDFACKFVLLIRHSSESWNRVPHALQVAGSQLSLGWRTFGYFRKTCGDFPQTAAAFAV